MMRATVVEEKVWYEPHRTRMRCIECDKVAYPDQDTAEKAAKRISERVPMRAYFKSRCGWWHVTRVKRH